MIPNKMGILHVIIKVWRPSAITILFLLHSHSVFKQRRTKDTELEPSSTQTPDLIWQQLIDLVCVRGSDVVPVDLILTMLAYYFVPIKYLFSWENVSERIVKPTLAQFQKAKKVSTEAAISYQVSGVPEERQVLYLCRI